MKIICTAQSCIYNRDGECFLSYAASPGDMSYNDCVYFVRSAKEKLL